MTEREVNLVEPAVLFVDAILGLVVGHPAVRVGRKKFRENDLIRVSTTDRERAAHDCPLGFAIQTEHFSKIMHKSGKDEPARMTILANCFGGLKEMLDLGEVGIGVAVV